MIPLYEQIDDRLTQAQIAVDGVLKDVLAKVNSQGLCTLEHDGTDPRDDDGDTRLNLDLSIRGMFVGSTRKQVAADLAELFFSLADELHRVAVAPTPKRTPPELGVV